MTQDGKPTSLADVIKRGIRAALVDVHTMIPGRVERVNMDGDKIKSVDVQPLVKLGVLDEELQRQVETLPQVPNCAVHFMGAGNYRITVPLQTGDTGMLVFSEASLDKWLARGGLVDPQIDHRMNLSDGVFVPGLRDFSNLWAAPADKMTIGKDDGPRIHIDGSQIKVGTDVAVDLDKPVLEDLLKTYFTALRGWMSAHVHTSAVPGSPTTPPTILPVPSPGNLGAPNVLIKKT